MKQRLKLRSLSARYQQTENFNNNSAISPSMIGYFAMISVGLSISFLRLYAVKSHGEGYFVARMATTVRRYLLLLI